MQGLISMEDCVDIKIYSSWKYVIKSQGELMTAAKNEDMIAEVHRDRYDK